jgi:hypothetical protein
MRVLTALSLLAAICACTPAPSPDISQTETAASDNVVSPDGFGQVHIGVALAEAQANLGAALGPVDAIDDPNVCVEAPYRTTDGQEVIVMFEQARAARVSIRNGAPSVRTEEGIGVGSTGAEVRAAYPDVIEEPSKYDAAPAHDLIVWRTPNESGLRFEIGADGRVAVIHAGGPAILYVEGCA